MISLIFDPFGPEKEKFRDFLERHVDSFITWDLLVFFYNNPTAAETGENLASRLGRQESDLLPSLQSMVDNDILKLKKNCSKTVYSYAPDSKLQKKIEEFVEALESRDKRLAVLTHVLQKEASYNPVNQ